MDKILTIIFQQYMQLYTGAFLMSIYYRLTNQNISFKDIIKHDEENRNSLRYMAFYWGLIFWMIVVVICVWVFN